MATTFLDSPVDVTPSTSSSWVDIDNSNVPDDASGVILTITNDTTDTTDLNIGWRKNGSTDNRHSSIEGWSNGTQTWVSVGCDGSGIFEVYLGDYTNQTVYLWGYYKDEATFLTNGSDYSIGSTSTWTDVDISSDTGATPAKGAILEHYQSSGIYASRVRRNGSTDVIQGITRQHNGSIIGCDSGEVFEHYIDDTSSDLYLLGYFTDETYFYINSVDISPGSTGSYEDLSSLPVGSTAGIVIVRGDTAATQVAVRKNGDTFDNYQGTNQSVSMAVVPCDSSYIIEAKKEVADDEFYLTGYILPLTSEITDNFDRANSDSIGSDWNEIVEGAGDLDIKTSKLHTFDRGDSPRATAMYKTSDPTSKDQYVKFAVDNDTGSEIQSSPILRNSSNANMSGSYYEVTFRSEYDDCFANCYVSGSLDHQLEVNDITITEGDTILTTIETYDASTVILRFYVNGYYYAQWSDTNANRVDATGSVGLQGGRDKDQFDNFEAGILGAAAEEGGSSIAASRRMVIIS